MKTTKPGQNFQCVTGKPLKRVLMHFFIFCLFGLTAQIGFCQNFVTEWSFPEAASEIRFRALTSGVVSYTWIASPSGNSGSGSFVQGEPDEVSLLGLAIEAGDLVTLELQPENLSRFFISNGPDREQITAVVQWGSVNWTSMEEAFWRCPNLDVMASDSPDLSNVTSMFRMFSEAESFNHDLGNWDVSGVTNMHELFNGAVVFNQDIGNWDVSSVVDMGRIFRGAVLFNQDISSWDVSNVIEIDRAFENAESFNQDVGSWDVSSVTNMRRLFREAYSFNQDLGDWDVSSVSNMDGLFSEAVLFNYDIGGWDVSSVTTMDDTFGNTDFFNQDIGSWDVSNVQNMDDMFENAAVFNQDIGGWDVSNVETMNAMFSETDSFNVDISSWDVSNVTEMVGTFQEALSFNQDISSWNVANVEDMYGIFYQAEAFNQNIGPWIFHPEIVMNNFFDESGMDCDHYSATLAGFLANNPDLTNRYFEAEGIFYGSEAIVYRDSLINEQGWTISGDEFSGEDCGLLLSTASISSIEANAIVVFPNPAMDKISIEGSEVELRQVRVFNALGRDVSSETPLRRKAHNEVEADLSSLACGVYLIKTATQTSRVVKR